MVKRYYCDYCDRSFPYSVEARKKHINGYHHQKLKTVHYNRFRTASEILHEETKKEKCRRFHSGQECSFGDACIYSHLTISDLDRLKEEAYLEKASKAGSHLRFRKDGEPSVEKWISKKFKGDQHITQIDVLDENDWEMKFKIPDTISASLPPSLVPPTLDSLLNCEFEDWG